MKYRLFLIIATSVVLGSTASCSWDNEFVDATDGDQKTPISFNVNIGTLPTPTVTTRGYTTNSSESGYTFNGDEYVAIGLTHPSGSEVIKQYLVGAGNSGGNSLTYKKEADGTTTGNTFDWLSTTETGVSIRAWSDGVSTAASTPVVDPDGHTFTVEMTQSGNVKELLYSPAASYSYTTSAINIPLYHQLSRIVVTIIRENTSNTISSVTIGHDSDGNRVPITGTFTKPGSTTNYGSWSVASEATQLTHWSVITPKEETTGSVYSAVVIPTTYAADMRLFNIKIGTQTFTYKVPTGGQTFEAGKQYNYTITVGNKGITVTSNITDWTDAADESSTTPDFTHGDGLAVIKNIKMNPLWYMAEYSVNNTSGTSMATSVNTSSFFSWSDAMSLFAAQTTSYSDYRTVGKTLTNGGDYTYHLPVQAELWSIIPNDTKNIKDLTDGYKESSLVSKFGYNTFTKNTGIADKYYWHKESSTEMHAIRFLGTPFCSAWKYVWSGYTFTISATLIDVIDANATIAADYYTNNWSTIAWNSNYSVQRVLYMVGCNTGGTSDNPNQYENTCGYLWSATEYDTDYAWRLGYSDPYGGVNHDHAKTYGLSVRLFRDN